MSGLQNDFEAVVFEQHPVLGGLKKRLVRAGAAAALMSGSGSAVFGLFRNRQASLRAAKLLGEVGSFQITLLSRARYRASWRRALGKHANPATWPPQSRY